MRGKEKCKALKEIRKQIAEQNDIAYAVSECTFQGECKGTCPKCESELRYLEKELAVKQRLGKTVAVVGISASVCTGLTACSPGEAIEDFLWEVGKKVGIVEETSGVLPAPTTSGGTTTTTIDGDIQLPEPTEAPLQGDMPWSEPAQTPERIEIEGKAEELITPLPEVLEGDMTVMVTPMPVIEGGIIPAQGEVLMGEIYVPVEGQE